MILLPLLVLLTPGLTIAPLSAIEPQRAGPRPIDMLDPPAPPPRVQLIDDLAAPPRAPVPLPIPRPILNDRFEAAMAAAREEAGAYGITLAAVRDGEVFWSGSSGVHRDGAGPMAPDDPLVIGSVTKTFVAAATMQLVEEGRLDLDDALRDHVQLPAINREITIRQLLDHTSGLADVYNERTRKGLEDDPGRAWTAAEVLRTIRPAWYEPGEGWAYANTNYFLLGVVIERVTGSPLADELERRFLGPLEMGDTRLLTGAVDDGGPLAPAWATIFWASGAMSASATDLARWGDALYDGDILTDASREAMIELNSHDYGLGLQRIQVPGAIGYGHTGLLNAYTTLLLYLPAEDTTVALLVNRNEVDLGEMLAAEPRDGPSLLELIGVEPLGPKLP